jgi:hypothetical protein
VRRFGVSTSHTISPCGYGSRVALGYLTALRAARRSLARDDGGILVRHCEPTGPARLGRPDDRLREAIQKSRRVEALWIASSLALLAMTSVRIPAARFVSELCIYFVAPSKQRAQGMPGAQPHPQSSWAKKENAHKSSGRAEIARHSLRNGFTAYSALSPVCRAF